MMRGLPRLLCDLARRVLPAARRSWADAMVAELPQAEGDRAALIFAGGCLLAALRERARDVDTQVSAGLWSVAIVTAMYAMVILRCGVRGVAVLLGTRDGMHDALARHGASPAVIAHYEAARPIVVVCFLALGIGQVATAWFLSRGEMRGFAAAWSIALVIAFAAVAIQLSVVWDVAGLPTEFHALLVQAITVPALIAWSQNRQKDLPGERG